MIGMRNGPYELVVAPPEYPGKRYRDRYCYEHHLVWWRTFGYLLRPGEIIHHKNGRKRDNRIENLELTDTSAHATHHGAEKPKIANYFKFKCAACGIAVQRRKVLTARASKRLFCSRKCGGQARFVTNKQSRIVELLRRS